MRSSDNVPQGPARQYVELLNSQSGKFQDI